jgi:hypothetical protein
VSGRTGETEQAQAEEQGSGALPAHQQSEVINGPTNRSEHSASQQTPSSEQPLGWQSDKTNSDILTVPAQASPFLAGNLDYPERPRLATHEIALPPVRASSTGNQQPPVHAASIGNDGSPVLATGTDGATLLTFPMRRNYQQPVLAASTGNDANNRVAVAPVPAPCWYDSLPVDAKLYWHLYRWNGKYDHTKHQSGRIRVFVLYGPKWDRNTKELLRDGNGDFVIGRVRPYDAFIPEESYQLLKEEGYGND